MIATVEIAPFLSLRYKHNEFGGVGDVREVLNSSLQYLIILRVRRLALFRATMFVVNLNRLKYLSAACRTHGRIKVGRGLTHEVPLGNLCFAMAAFDGL